MKINIISDTKIKDAGLDLEVIDFMFKKIREKTELHMEPVSAYKIKNKASINIFINCVNYNFFKDAKTNIIIVDHSIISKSVLDYLPIFDHVIVKDSYTQTIITSYLENLGIKASNVAFMNMGWGSPNITEFTRNKNFGDVLLYIPSLRDPIFKAVIDTWKPEYPRLNVVGAERLLQRPTADNIIFHDNCKNDEFHRMFNTIGFHLIPDKYNGFQHLVGQCIQVGCVPICLDTASNRELVEEENSFLIPCKRAKNKIHPDMLGPSLSVNMDSLHNTLLRAFNKGEKNLELMSRDNITTYNKYYSKFGSLFRDNFTDIIRKTRNTAKPQEIKLVDSELPKVSLITPTYNRPDFFKLAILNFNSFNYPRDKLEWIVVDDSDNNDTENQLPPEEHRGKYNITYLRVNEEEGSNSLMSIGEKRNLAVSKASGEIIVCMDDDDYYYPDYLRNRVNNLASVNASKGKRCLTCTHLGIFEFKRCVSMIFSPRLETPFAEQVACSSLVFYRDFWNRENGHIFEDCSRGEGEQFVSTRLQLVEPVAYENNIVCLAHENNIRDICPPSSTDRNGSHFKFTESVFKFITSIGEKPKEKLPEAPPKETIESKEPKA